MRKVLAIGATAAFALTACAQSGSTSLEGTVLAGNVRTVSAGALTGSDVGAAQQAFGLDVLTALCAKASTPNTTAVAVEPGRHAWACCDAGLQSVADAYRPSPSSSTFPNGATTSIAAQQERTAALGVVGYRPQGPGRREQPCLGSARCCKPTQDYLDDVRTAFGADLRTVDFAGKPEARQPTRSTRLGRP